MEKSEKSEATAEICAVRSASDSGSDCGGSDDLRETDRFGLVRSSKSAFTGGIWVVRSTLLSGWTPSAGRSRSVRNRSVDGSAPLR